jgi:hypothetical protein
MTTLADVALLNYYVLELSLRDVDPTPSDVIGWIDKGHLLDKMTERGLETGIDVSGFHLLFEGERGRILSENLESWANVADPSRKYGMSDDGPNGWHALLFGLIDQFYRPYGDEVAVTW